MSLSQKSQEMVLKDQAIASKRCWRCLNCVHTLKPMISIRKNRYLPWEDKVRMVLEWRSACNSLDEFEPVPQNNWNTASPYQEDERWESEQADAFEKLPREYSCKNFVHYKAQAKTYDCKGWARLVKEVLMREKGPDGKWVHHSVEAKVLVKLLCEAKFPIRTKIIIGKSKLDDGLWNTKFDFWFDFRLDKYQKALRYMRACVLIYLKNLLDKMEEKEAMLLILSSAQKWSVGGGLWWWMVHVFKDPVALKLQEESQPAKPGIEVRLNEEILPTSQVNEEGNEGETNEVEDEDDNEEEDQVNLADLNDEEYKILLLEEIENERLARA